jgi:hypothetical protein
MVNTLKLSGSGCCCDGSIVWRRYYLSPPEKLDVSEVVRAADVVLRQIDLVTPFGKSMPVC